tara:strand:+ start:150 stop:854 length:705 start_codon:yes stop_codon:yes gene_type:complete
MPLPTVEAPTYNLTLPDSKKKLKYRPFRVKEEKVLMLASESGDINTIYQAVHDIVLTCTNGKLNIFKESSIDSEYALIKLRSCSVGDTMKPNLLCAHCNNPCSVKIKADDLVIDDKGSKDNKIEVDKKMIIELRYPSFADEIKNSGIKDQVDMVFDSVCSAIDKIYYEEEIFDAKEYKQNEIEEFVDALDASVFTEIIEFINTKPRVKIPVKFKCPKCENDNEMEVEGMEGFFA